MNLKRLFMAFVLPLAFMAFANAQDRVVTGKVTDSKDGTPVMGVSVMVKGTNKGTQTTSDGSFRLSVPSGATTLVISSIGYTNQEVAIGSGTVNVSLVAGAGNNLNEVVVIGYGTQRKKDITSAVVSVTEKDFQQGVITSPEQLIAGKVAGVQITSNSGAPGDGSVIRIRGGASLNASNDPLIVIDGVPISQSLGIPGSSNPLNMINPDDIESINILKDASAAAIYGSRGSNGVIIITTKKGVRGKPRFTFNTQVGVSMVPKKVDVLSPAEFRNLVNTYGNTTQKALMGLGNTDWQNEIYTDAIISDNSISVAGSLKNLPYRVSYGLTTQDGVLKGDNFTRNSLALNVTPRFLKDHLKIDVNLKGTLTTNTFADRGAVGNAVAFDPTQLVFSGKTRLGGYYEWLDPATGKPNTLSPRNPVALLNQRNDNSNVQRSIGNIQIDYKFHFLPELRANLNLGYDMAQGKGSVYVPDSAASLYPQGGLNNTYKQGQENKLLEFYLNYAKDIPSIQSRIDVTAGYGYQDFLTKVYNYPSYRANGTVIGGSEPVFATDRPQYTMISNYGRLVYSFKNKYILNAIYRMDASSRVKKENRWGIFPAVSFAWRVKDEPFMKSLNLVNDLKFRIGYGITGQQEGIGNYDYIPNYAISTNTAQYQFGSSFYYMYRPSGYDPDRKWEQTATTNVGIDFSILKNRISGSMDYFFKKTKDLLATVNLPAGSNFTNQIVTNVGNVEAKGFELSLNTNPVKLKNFSWDFNINFSYSKATITNLTKSADSSFIGFPIGGVAGGTGNTIQINSVGYSPNTFYVYQQVYDANGKPIEGAYVDQNGDGTINEKDLYRYKSPAPNYLLGITTGVTYKKWSASVALRASFNNYMYNNYFSNRGVKREILNPANFLSNGSRNVLETNFYNTQVFSDYYVENASFLRMDNLNIGYNVGKVFMNRATMRVYASMQNVFVITKYKGLDPELSGGIDNNIYPRPRITSLGLNLNF
jgi:TonB-dependent starch-binding outer membrane protein SusC